MPVTRMEHLLVLTDDIDGTRDFWCAALGLEVGARPPLEFSGHWLYTGDVPCVHVADRGEYTAHAAGLGREASATAVDHVAFNGEDYSELAGRLERNGVDAMENEIPGVMRQLFLTDPNGLTIEINVPLEQKEPL
jgi:catechol 2,3-dioxygenase-like lactoylglutathione lyase family enzyme